MDDASVLGRDERPLEEVADDPDRVLRALDQVGVADVGKLDQLDVLVLLRHFPRAEA